MSTIATAAIVRELMRRAGITETDDLKKVLDTENLSTIPQDLWDKISNQVISKEHATKNVDVRKALKREHMVATEKAFDTALKVAGIDTEQFYGENKPTTFQDRLNSLTGLDGHYKAIYKTKEGDDQSVELRKTIERLQGELKASVTAREEMQKSHDGALHQMRVRNAIGLELSKHPFKKDLADAADGLRPFIVGELEKKAVYKFDNGQIKLFNPADPNVALQNEKYEDVTLSALVASHVGPYVKKSDKDDKPDPITTPGGGRGANTTFGAGPLTRN